MARCLPRGLSRAWRLGGKERRKTPDNPYPACPGLVLLLSKNRVVADAQFKLPSIFCRVVQTACNVSRGFELSHIHHAILLICRRSDRDGKRRGGGSYVCICVQLHRYGS